MKALSKENECKFYYSTKDRSHAIVLMPENNRQGIGMGITEKAFKTLLDLKVDCVTMGNHTWAKKDIFNFIDNPKLIRPANYPKEVCGKGYNVYRCKDKKIAVINALGRAEINIMLDNPFAVVKDIVDRMKKRVVVVSNGLIEADYLKGSYKVNEGN